MTQKYSKKKRPSIEAEDPKKIRRAPRDPRPCCADRARGLYTAGCIKAPQRVRNAGRFAKAARNSRAPQVAKSTGVLIGSISRG